MGENNEQVMVNTEEMVNTEVEVSDNNQSSVAGAALGALLIGGVICGCIKAANYIKDHKTAIAAKRIAKMEKKIQKLQDKIQKCQETVVNEEETNNN